MADILSVVRRNPDNDEQAEFPGLDFTRATFKTPAQFAFARFRGNANFSRVTFAAGAEFGGTVFDQHGIFHQAEIRRRAFFKAAVFNGDGDFREADFGGEVTGLNIASATTLNCSKATFRAATTVIGGVVRDVLLDDCSFDSNTRLDLGNGYERPRERPIDRRRVDMKGAMFLVPGDLGWIVTGEEVDLSGTRFEAGFDLRVSASRVRLTRMRTAGGAHIEFDGDLDLSDADIAGSALVSALRAQREDGEPGPARIVSMQRSTVGQLTVSSVDLRECRFLGAHRLDGLRIERCVLPETPRGWYSNGSGARVRCGRRQTIFEEHLYRRQQLGSGTPWDDPHHAGNAAPSDSEVLTPSAQEISGIYRSLRKGREDAKDSPGGSDFYYGEMEMRRLAPRSDAAEGGPRSADRGEAFVLAVYWLVAGYGLRSSRALGALAVTVALLAIVLDLWGFGAAESYGRSLLFAVESSIGLLRPPTANLTMIGEVTQIILRIVGPVLVGLALLSVRGRVKR